jgi:4-amino-4-deoxy-L-arabinose transferase-like glycosyltransferase
VTVTEVVAPVVGAPKRSRAPQFVLLGVLLVFVALSTVIAVKTPAWEANDEEGHVQNIEALASGHWYAIPFQCHLTPKVGTLFNCAGPEPQQPPLYYAVAAGWQKMLGLPIQPAFRGQYNPALFLDHHNPALLGDHTANHGWVLWMRYLSILLGVLTLFVTFLAVRLVTSDPWTPVVAAGVLAFIPRFVFLASFVTNDILVALLGAALMYVSLRFALSPSWWRMGLIGVVYGLLVITKLSALPMGLIIVAAAFLVAGWKQRAQYVGIAACGTLLVSGWYLIQNTVRYGDPLALRATTKYLTYIDGLGKIDGRPYFVHNLLQHVFIKVPQEIVHSIWFQSGWGQFNWPSWVNWTITVAVLVLVATLVRSLCRRDVLAILGVLVVSALLCVWMTSFSTGFYAGRYAIAGFPALAAVLGLAVERWRPGIRFILPTAGLLGTVIAFNADVLAVHWS